MPPHLGSFLTETESREVGLKEDSVLGGAANTLRAAFIYVQRNVK